MIRPRDRASAKGLLPRMEARPRKDGLITYRYHPAGGKPVNLGTDRTEACRRVLDLNGRADDAGTLAEVWRLYRGTGDHPAEAWKLLSPRTQRDYEVYSVPLLRVFGAAGVAVIQPSDIARYLRVERADAPVRANREIALLSNLMREAVERGMREVNPCKQVRKNKERPRTEAPEPDELDAFVAWVAQQTSQRAVVGLMAEFAALAGNRRAEFLDLSRTQIDRQAGVIRLLRAKQHGGTVKVELVTITPALAAVLDRADRLPGAADRQIVFPSRDGNRYTEAGFTTLWGRVMRAALAEGVVKRRFTFHDLRAYYTTQHKAQTGDLPELHASTSTTARVYDRSKAVRRSALNSHGGNK